MTTDADVLERDDDLPTGGGRRQRPVVRWAALAVGLLVLVLGVTFALRLDEPADYRGTALLGRPVPDLVLPTIDGGEVDLASLGGKAVIVNFWNSWCIPCREEEPALQAFYARHAGEPDFMMVGIVRDDSESNIREWVEDHGTPWTVAFDPGARAAVDFGTTGQPETYAVAADGTVVGRHAGRATLDDLEALLARARGGEPEEAAS